MSSSVLVVVPRIKLEDEKACGYMAEKSRCAIREFGDEVVEMNTAMFLFEYFLGGDVETRTPVTLDLLGQGVQAARAAPEMMAEESGNGFRALGLDGLVL